MKKRNSKRCHDRKNQKRRNERCMQTKYFGKWQDKRDVLYISTEFKNDIVTAQNRNGIIKEKPLPIVEYNKFMSGMDRMNEMSYYPSVRKSLR